LSVSTCSMISPWSTGSQRLPVNWAMQTHIDRLERERDATKDKDEKRRIKLEIIGFYGSATTNDQTPCKFGRTGWLCVPAADGYQA